MENRTKRSKTKQNKHKKQQSKIEDNKTKTKQKKKGRKHWKVHHKRNQESKIERRPNIKSHDTIIYDSVGIDLNYCFFKLNLTWTMI